MEKAPRKKRRTTINRSHQAPLVFVGCVVQTPSFGILSIDPKATIVVSARTGLIEAFYASQSFSTSPVIVFGDNAAQCDAAVASARESGTLHVLQDGEFLMPGFVDCHLHAPQYSYTGTGLDLPLMGPNGWLEQYTFPSERSLGGDAEEKHRDTDGQPRQQQQQQQQQEQQQQKKEEEDASRSRAEAVYERVVGRTLQSGTTTALYFASLDLAPTLTLASTMLKLGQRGFVGKVCMDRHSPPDYSHSCARNLRDSEALVRALGAMQAASPDAGGESPGGGESAGSERKRKSAFGDEVGGGGSGGSCDDDDGGGGGSKNNGGNDGSVGGSVGSVGNVSGGGQERFLVGAALTPRFVPTCSLELLKGLSRLYSAHTATATATAAAAAAAAEIEGPPISAARTERRKASQASGAVAVDVLIQTHVAESIDEVAFCRALHPSPQEGGGRGLETLEACGLLTPRTVLAHGVHLSPHEVELVLRRGASVAHCPLSNAYFAGAVLPAKELIRQGVNVGLGTDVAGGYDPSMLSALRTSVFASRLLQDFRASSSSPLSTLEAPPSSLQTRPSYYDHSGSEKNDSSSSSSGGGGGGGGGGGVGSLSSSSSPSSSSALPTPATVLAPPAPEGPTSCRQQQLAETETTTAANRKNKNVATEAEEQEESVLPKQGVAATSGLDYKEALWMATVGGAKVLGLGTAVGRLEKGYVFDALRVSMGGSSPSSSWQGTRKVPFSTSRVDVFPTDAIEDIVQKFLHCGDDRDISQVWVQGRLVVSAGEPTALPPPS